MVFRASAMGVRVWRTVDNRVVVPRWIQAVALPLLVAGAYLVARAAGHVILLFTIAGVIALILNPVVAFLQRRRVPRGPAIALVYLAVLGVLSLAGLLLAQPVTDQVEAFREDVPSIIDDANASLADLQETLDERGIDVEIKRQGETALQTLQEQVLGGTGDIVSFGGDLLRTIVAAGFGLVLVFVLSVYMLVYGPRIGAIVRSVLPRRRHAGGRLPHGRAEGRRGVRARPAAVQPHDGRERRARPVDLRSAGDLPRGPHVRRRVRDLLRRHGARAVHRPGAGRAAADARRALRRSARPRSGSACCSSRSSSSRATSSRR